MVAPASKLTPRHIAITMDGNGRWAAGRGLTRSAGHPRGAHAGAHVYRGMHAPRRGGPHAVRLLERELGAAGAGVGSLMGLFLEALEREIEELHAKGVRLRFIGERRDLPVRLQTRFAAAQQRTSGNGGLKLQVAVSYGDGGILFRQLRSLRRNAQAVRYGRRYQREPLRL